MGCVSSTILDLEYFCKLYDNDVEFCIDILEDSRKEIVLFYNLLVKSVMNKDYENIKYSSYS